MGVNDFHLENIGDVTVARFGTDTQRKRLHFATVRACTPDVPHAIALAALWRWSARFSLLLILPGAQLDRGTRHPQR